MRCCADSRPTRLSSLSRNLWAHQPNASQFLNGQTILDFYSLGGVSAWAWVGIEAAFFCGACVRACRRLAGALLCGRRCRWYAGRCGGGQQRASRRPRRGCCPTSRPAPHFPAVFFLLSFLALTYVRHVKR